jgi:hypothetical protein
LSFFVDLPNITFTRANDAHKFWYVLVVYMVCFFASMYLLLDTKFKKVYRTVNDRKFDLHKAFVEMWGLFFIFLVVTLVFCVCLRTVDHLLHFLYVTQVLCCVLFVVDKVMGIISLFIENEYFHLSTYTVPVLCCFACAVFLQNTVSQDIERIMQNGLEQSSRHIFTYVKVAVKMLVMYLIVIVFNVSLRRDVIHVAMSIELLFTLIFLYADSILHTFDFIMKTPAEYQEFFLKAYFICWISLLCLCVRRYDMTKSWRIVAFNWYTMKWNTVYTNASKIIVCLFLMHVRLGWMILVTFFHAHAMFTCKMLLQFWFPNSKYKLEEHMNFNPLLLWF